MNKRIFKFIIFSIVLSSCNMRFTPTKVRIYVVQEVKISDNESFFWFRNEQEILHEGLSYFQITDDKCKLSVKSANAYCELPEEVFDFKNDTVFILTRSNINFINPIKKYAIEAVGYENGLYDVNKKPKKESMFFLDTVCH
ncbi:MAG: hypothetical protein WDO71_19520 [Bacteroidota bacterium]